MIHKMPMDVSAARLGVYIVRSPVKHSVVMGFEEAYTPRKIGFMLASGGKRYLANGVYIITRRAGTTRGLGVSGSLPWFRGRHLPLNLNLVPFSVPIGFHVLFVCSTPSGPTTVPVTSALA